MARRKHNQDSDDLTDILGEIPIITEEPEIVPEYEWPMINLDELPEPPKNGVTEGRMVHFVLVNGEHRPAVIVKAWNLPSYGHAEVNMQVFMDGTNDPEQYGSTLYWATSVPFDDDQKRPGTWHWIEPA